MSAASRSIVVGTGGHIDHGKTTLVRALTGIDTDRLPEEKRRGITIDLGFASAELRVSDGSSVSVSFVDVPGHRLFVRNMLAGATGIDSLLLVISAEDGVMPQTEEHVAICELLGIPRGIAVLTKTDAVSAERLAQTRGEVGRYLDQTFLRGSPLLEASAITGDGMDELKTALAELAQQTPARRADRLPRLPLDRAFVMKGFGTVVTGTLQSGVLRRGDALVLEPPGLAVRVRGVQRHGNTEEQAAAGSRVALNLSGVQVGEVHRGATLVMPETLCAVHTLDVEIVLLPDAPPLKHRSRVRFHCFTAESPAAVSLYSAATMEAGERALGRLRLARPTVLLPDDRFVLRQLSPPRTIGGGRVLDAGPPLHGRRKAAAGWLAAMQTASLEQQLLLRVARRGVQGLAFSALTHEMGLTMPAIKGLAAPWLHSGELVKTASGLLLTVEASAAARHAVEGVLAGLPHGIKRSELRSRTGLSAEVLHLSLARLAADKRVQLEGEAVLPPQGARALAAAEQEASARIAETYRAASLQPPLLAGVLQELKLNEPAARKLLTLLLREGTLVKIALGDMFVHQAALADLRSSVAALRGQLLDVQRFKQLTGLSRKHAIPLLEWLDRERITRKQGETRMVL